MSPWKEIGRYGFVGVEFVSLLAVGFFGGRWLDGRLHARGWLAWGGLLLGIYSGFHMLVVTARRLQHETEREEREEEAARAEEEARVALRARLDEALDDARGAGSDPQASAEGTRANADARTDTSPMDGAGSSGSDANGNDKGHGPS